MRLTANQFHPKSIHYKSPALCATLKLYSNTQGKARCHSCADGRTQSDGGPDEKSNHLTSRKPASLQNLSYSTKSRHFKKVKGKVRPRTGHEGPDGE